MCLSLQHLIRFKEGPAFVKRIVVGDQSWYHLNTPGSQRTNIQNITIYLLIRKKKVKAMPTARKVMWTLLIDFQPQKYAIKSTKYYSILKNFVKQSKENCLAFPHSK
ncbi:hypothetical protein NPIL_311921 [Nephila pilipes]|uniref:Uncharacterized protein n=1 Tax=Nephila pilipes TaxID=299642 RepID=A0A8X6NPX5_NEPPI|nr:hypothetical protein NPIL_311921 [Nephila pilipes]